MPAINLYNLPLEDFRGAHLAPEGYGDQVAGEGRTGNGASKHLSTYYSNAGDAAAAFPLVPGLALTDELDYAATQQLIAQMEQPPPAGVHPQRGGLIELHHKGLYIINKPLVIGSYINLLGGGQQTVLSRAAGVALPAGQALLDIQGGSVGVSVSNLLIEGNVLTSTGIDRGSISDPFDSRLTLNSSIWIHGAPGADTTDIDFVDCTIQHTGGYGAILDARNGNIRRVKFTRCTFINNRPHLFGSGGDLNYGSWTGGILYANVGDPSTNSFCVSDVTFENCHFYRCSGNGIWGWNSYGKGSQVANLITNRSITIIDCVFEDMGLSASQMGNVTGGGVQDCTFHRIGYITRTDTDTPSPAYNPDGVNIAVAIDTSGYASNINYTGNKGRSINGDACIDADGLRNSSIKDNDFSIPLSTDGDYATDQVGLYGPSRNGVIIARGINTGNTNQNGAAQNLQIVGNHFSNMGYAAIALYYLKYSTVSNNKIYHAPNAPAPPIELGSLTGASFGGPAGAAEFYCYDNAIINNRIEYSTTAFCIVEVGDGWQSGHANRYYGNICTGLNYGEIQINANSGSNTFHLLSTSYPMPRTGSEVLLQREGFDNTFQAGTNTACLKIYTRTYANSGNGIVNTVTQMMQLADVGPVLNVSNNGQDNTGAITTGNISTLSFYHSVNTKRLISSAGFLGIFYSGVLDTVQDTLDPPNAAQGNWCVLRYRPGVLEYSTSTGPGGVRIYKPISGSSGASSSGMVNYVQLSDGSGGFISSPYCVFDPALMRLTVQGQAGTPAIYVPVGYVQGLIYTDAPTNWEAIHTTGGVHAVGGVSVDQAIYLKATAGPNFPGSGYSGIAYKQDAMFWYYNMTAARWDLVDFSAIGMGGVTSVMGTPNQIAVAPYTGSVVVSLPALATTTTFNVTASTGSFTVGGTTVIDGNTNAFVHSLTTTNATTAPLGGVNALTMVAGSTSGQALWLPSGGITAQTATFNSTANNAVQVPGGGVTAVIFVSSQTSGVGFQTSNNKFYADGLGDVYGAGVATFDSGFYSKNLAYNTIQTEGGVFAKHYAYGVTSAGPLWSASAANPWNPDKSHPAGNSNGYGALQHNHGAVWNYYDPELGIWSTVNFQASASGGAPGGTNYNVQYNLSGISFGGSANFTFDPGAQQLVVTGKGGTLALLVTSGWLQANESFYSPNTIPNTVNIPNGGLTAKTAILGHSAFGQTAPLVIASDDANNRGIISECYATAANANYLGIYKARGSSAAPVAVASGDFVMNISGGGYDGSTFQPTGRIRFFVDGPVSLGNVPMSFELSTGSNAGAIPRMYVNSAGTMTFGTTIVMDQSGSMTFTGLLHGSGTSSAISCDGNQVNSIQCWQGGMQALYFNALGTVYNAVQIAQQGGGLSFGAHLGEKIALFDGGAGSRYGFGIDSSLLQIYAAPGSNVGIGNGSSAAFNNILHVAGNNCVGIRTVPSAPLHVFGNVSGEIARFQGASDFSNYRTYISLYTTNPSFWWGITNQDAAGNGTQNGLGFFEYSNALYAPRMYFQQTTTAPGNIGINTTNPANLLTIIPTASPTTLAASNQLAIGEGSNNGGYRLSLGYGYVNNAHWTGVIQTFDNGGGSYLALNPSGGKVGIGTVLPDSVFTVIPTVQATTLATANQVAIGEPSNLTAYRMTLGFGPLYNAFWAGVIQTVANSSFASSCLILNPQGGPVGIGTQTAAPAYALDVVSTDNSETGGLRIQAQNLTQNVRIGWAGIDATFYFRIRAVQGPIYMDNAIASASQGNVPSLIGIPGGYGAIQHHDGPRWNYYDPNVGWRIVDLSAVSGTNYNQSLNTTDTVTFAAAMIAGISFTGGFISGASGITASAATLAGITFSGGAMTAGGEVSANNFSINHTQVISNATDAGFRSVNVSNGAVLLGTNGIVNVNGSYQINGNDVITNGRAGQFSGITFGAGGVVGGTGPVRNGAVPNNGVPSSPAQPSSDYVSFTDIYAKNFWGFQTNPGSPTYQKYERGVPGLTATMSDGKRIGFISGVITFWG